MHPEKTVFGIVIDSVGYIVDDTDFYIGEPVVGKILEIA